MVAINKMNGNIENTENNKAIVEDKQKRKRVVTKKLHNLPHPNAKFEYQLKMIKVYVIATNKGQKAVKSTDLANLIDFSIGYVNGTNRFFEEIGILERRGLGLYIPTQAAIDFCNSLEWKDEAKAKEILKKLIEKSWVWETTQQHLSINDGKSSVTDLIRRLGLECQADQRLHKLCFNSIIDYLKYVNLIKEDIDGNITANEAGLIDTNIEKPIVQLENKINTTDATKKPQEEKIPIELAKKEAVDLDFVIYKTSGIELRFLPTNKNVEKLKKFLEVLSLEIN